MGESRGRVCICTFTQCTHTHTHTRTHTQDHKFDVADRLFFSVPAAWRMCTTSLSEVKELTPEWYSSPLFLRNHAQYAMGRTQDLKPVGDVALPPWAKSPEHFIATMRAALESEYVCGPSWSAGE